MVTDILREERLDPAHLQEQLGATVAAHHSVPVAVCIAAAAEDFEAALTLAVSCGGDTDTIASMTGAIVGGRLGAAAIPGRWLDALEKGEKGREHVESLADRLAERAGRPDVVSQIPSR